MKLTKRQAVVLDAVREFYEREKIMPTTRELAQRLGCAQNAINVQLNELTRKGAIKRQPRKARSIVLVDPAEWPQEVVA